METIIGLQWKLMSFAIPRNLKKKAMWPNQFLMCFVLDNSSVAGRVVCEQHIFKQAISTWPPTSELWRRNAARSREEEATNAQDPIKLAIWTNNDKCSSRQVKEKQNRAISFSSVPNCQFACNLCRVRATVFMGLSKVLTVCDRYCAALDWDVAIACGGDGRKKSRRLIS